MRTVNTFTTFKFPQSQSPNENYLMSLLVLLLVASTVSASAQAPPPQVVWPTEFRAAVNESMNGERALYDTEYSITFNSEMRISNGTIQLFNYNSSKVYTIQPKGKTCTVAPNKYPIFEPNLAVFKYVGTDNGPFDVPTQLWMGQIEGQNFYYHVSTDGKQTPIGFCGEDDYVGVCLHWEVFVPVGPKDPWAPGYFDVPSYCP